ncbi:MAG TPA: N-6 DNA methylase [Candidatus Limnocylindrales bacterium]|nr:N-6 DNA methylase [Candidatus Limnocylindrales bacterium]
MQSLAKDFDAQKDFYLSPKYQEAEARRDFIDKFLLALGWDVNHDTQKNPYEQEVKVERKEHGVSQRRADYAFYLAPNFRDVKFYIEAKKPFGDIATPDNYFQTIRYGWNSQTPIAALFDFEQFEIVDCRFKPDLATALQRNLKKFHYRQYADKEVFAEIYWLFSREAVAGGALEKYAESLPKKRGAMLRGSYQSIDEAFLEELDAHRDTLAHIFKNSNPKLDGEALTEATQRTLDRLVFIRFLEDKLIEPQHLVARFGERGSAWGDFIATSKRLDGIYNGIVFKKNDILDSPTFKVDDDQFAKICASLSHVNSPYDFNAIPIHILGSIYERFLGKVIVATDKRARVEEKPEVRKAGGVYYTPEYIVRYIVENTVGKLIEGKTPAQIAEMRFADIACGSGSFLLGVYDLLIRYHTKFYNENPGKAKKGDVMPREDGLHLSLQKKREILVNNLYGVDIDNQAVEVAQLSLYLKLLQDETPGSARQYFLDFEQQALLPSLNKNIVCGNSLIGTDIMSGELFEPVEERKLNPMNFEDRFPQIFRRRRGDESQTSSGELHEASPGELDHATMGGMPLHGSYGKISYKKSKKDKTVPPPALPESEYEGGFDAIVGNPPYIRPHNLDAVTKEYFWKTLKTFVAKSDIYSCFMEKGMDLLRKGGVFSFIVPHTWTSLESFEGIRRKLATESEIVLLVQLPKKVFQDATVETCIFNVQKIVTAPRPNHQIQVLRLDNKSKCEKVRTFPQSDIASGHLFNFQLYAQAETSGFAARLKSISKPLAEFVKFVYGFKTADDDKFIHPDARFKDSKPFIRSAAIHRYCHARPEEFVWYVPEKMKANRSTARPGEAARFESEKIMVARMGKELMASYDAGGLYVKDAMLLLPKSDSNYSLKYLLALINSRLLGYFYQEFFITIDVLKNAILDLPIRAVDVSKPADKARHDKMVSLVEQMLAAKPHLARAQSDKDKDFYENKCAALDRQIDALVYDLYGLTPDEIKIVEGLSA